MDLTNREYRSLKKISKRPLRSGRINPKDMAALSRLIELGYVERSFSQQGDNQLNDTGEMLDEQSNHASQNRTDKRIDKLETTVFRLFGFLLGMLIVRLLSHILKFL